MSKVYGVQGMTCGHCVAAVTEEITGVPGVTAVDVSLEQNQVTVSGEGFEDAAISAAVEEAGYQLASG